MERVKRPTFEYTKLEGKPLTPLQIIRKISGLQYRMEDLMNMVPQFTDTVTVNIPAAGPIRFLPISDTHLFDMAVDYKLVETVFRKLEDKNTYTVLCGDFLAGTHPGIGSHVGEVMFALTNQVRIGKEIIRPLVEKGKLLAVVGMYNGHEEWSEKLATLSAIMYLTDGLKQPDGSPLQAIINGGDLTIKFSNNRQTKIGLFHDPGGGGSDDVNQVGALRNQGWKRPLNSLEKNDLEIAGHRHHRAAFSEEAQINRITGKTEITVYASLGAYKAVEKKRRDRFLTAQGKEPSKKPGFGQVLNVGRNGRTWSTFGFNKLDLLHKAANLFDKTESLGITSELVSKIGEKSKIDAKFDRRNSRAQIPDIDDVNVPLFDFFRWKISTNLPIALYISANARRGSTSGDKNRQELQEIVKMVQHDQSSFLLVLRHMLDPDVSKQADRYKILETLTNDLKPAYDSNSLLGFMLSSSLRLASWRKDVKAGDRIKKGFRPGDLIYKKLLPKTPIFLNDKIMNLEIGDINYHVLLMDELGRSGSSFDMFRGLVQSHRKTRLDLDIVVGGHMPGSGIMQTEKTTYIAPGWSSDFDSFGKANQTVAPKGGQGVIFLPNERGIFAASSIAEMRDIHTGLKLEYGLTVTEKVKIIRRK